MFNESNELIPDWKSEVPFKSEPVFRASNIASTAIFPSAKEATSIYQDLYLPNHYRKVNIQMYKANHFLANEESQTKATQGHLKYNS